MALPTLALLQRRTRLAPRSPPQRCQQRLEGCRAAGRVQAAAQCMLAWEAGQLAARLAQRDLPLGWVAEAPLHAPAAAMAAAVVVVVVVVAHGMHGALVSPAGVQRNLGTVSLHQQCPSMALQRVTLAAQSLLLSLQGQASGAPPQSPHLPPPFPASRSASLWPTLPPLQPAAPILLHTLPAPGPTLPSPRAALWALWGCCCRPWTKVAWELLQAQLPPCTVGALPFQTYHRIRPRCAPASSCT